MIANIILVVIIAIAVGGASLYIYRVKKSGENCIGCPNAKQCRHHKCEGSCSDHK